MPFLSPNLIVSLQQEYPEAAGPGLAADQKKPAQGLMRSSCPDLYPVGYSRFIELRNFRNVNKRIDLQNSKIPSLESFCRQDRFWTLLNLILI